MKVVEIPPRTEQPRVVTMGGEPTLPSESDPSVEVDSAWLKEDSAAWLLESSGTWLLEKVN